MASYKTLNASQRVVANAWLHDVFVIAGWGRNARPGHAYLFRDSTGQYENYIKSRCIKICETISTAAFTDIDEQLNNLARFHFTADIHVEDNVVRGVKKSPEVLASYIADFCARKRIYWDDTIHSNYEIDEFKKTYLGAALDAFGCFVSQPDLVKTRNLGLNTTSSSRSSSASTPGQPKNDYKSSGPQSANVRDLLSTPGQKEIFNNGYMFGIEGTNTKAQKVGAFAHIKPLSAVGAAGTTNKVFLGSSNGYTDCKVYLRDQVEADTFLRQCQANCPATITNLHVAKKSPDPNGYFKVRTEYGVVYISARKLNEDVDITTVTESVEAPTEEVDTQAMLEYFDLVDEFDKNVRYYN